MSLCFPERQVKLAYVMTEAKPPLQVRRKQAKYGTGKGVTAVEPPVKVTSRDRPSTSSSHHRASNVHSPKKHPGEVLSIHRGGGWENVSQLKNLSGLSVRLESFRKTGIDLVWCVFCC